MKRRQMLAWLLAVAMGLSLSGCRVRTTGVGEIPAVENRAVSENREEPPPESPPDRTPPLELPPELPDPPEEVEPPKEEQNPPEEQEAPPPVQESPAEPEELSGESEESAQEPEEPPEDPPEEPETDPEPAPETPTVENPEAERREYAPEAPAIEDEGAETPLQTEPVPEADPIPAEAGEGTGEAIAVEGESGEQTVTVTVPSEEAEQLGEASDAEEASTMAEYYQTLLDDRLGHQFECQRLYVYWETETDYGTVLKDSPEHRILTNAGCYSVSVKLLEDNLQVDGGWVARKNPGAIVKWVDSSVLGSGVSGTEAAREVRDAILGRPELAETEAVRAGRVLLLSRELVESEAGRLAAAVFLAAALYPDSFADVSGDEALTALTGEAGQPLSGIFAYAG